MKIMKSVFLLATLMVSSLPAAHAATISFDELKNGEAILEYYNGGFGSQGTGPGPNLGVSFSSGWIASAPDVYLVSGGRSAVLSGTETVNFHTAWVGTTSFYYMGGALTVRFYSQENGLGTLLDTLNLSAASIFTPAGDILGPVRSAVFISTGTGNRIDALTNGAFVIPEPGAGQLVVSGAGLLGLIALRRTRTKLP